MGKLHISTNSFNAVAAGQRATLDLPTGKWKYHQIRIEYGTSTVGGATRVNMEAELARIAIAVNGKEQQIWTAAQLFRLAEFRALTFSTGFITLFLGQPWFATPPGQDATSWGTADVTTLQVTVDIASGAIAPTLKARIVAEEKIEPMGAISKVRPMTLPVTATGVQTFTSLPRDHNYFAFWLFPTASADIAEVEIKVDQVERFRATRAQNEAYLKDMGWTIPVGAFWPILFNANARVSEPLMAKGAGELRLDLNMSAANTPTALLELVGLRD